MATIRRATPSDRTTILGFHRALYIDHRERMITPELAVLSAYRDLDGALRDDVDALLHNPSSIVLIAEIDDRVVGYATGHVETDSRRALPRKGVVEDWFVVPEERGRGSGRALLDALLEAFRGRGCDVAESMTWPTNEGARAAHAKAGFAEVEIKFRRRL